MGDAELVRCMACDAYIATTRVKFIKLDLCLCHSCLVVVRALAKEEFKRSEKERAKARRG